MSKRKISKSQMVILNSINYYLREMSKIHDEGFEDETSIDVENWAAARAMIYSYIDGEDEGVAKNALFKYLGDEYRTELVLSYYNISKYLLKNGIIPNV